MNTLYYGDNLKILREYVRDETVDLVYLDPPFNSNRNYNVLFRDESGKEADAQITAFEDTWHWTGAAQTYHELLMQADDVSKMIEAFYSFLGTNQMLAYLVMMTARLVELHRVLKPTGSLYLHCDPTASHYLKILLDTIFGAENFRNEIIWKRTGAHNDRAQGNVLHYGRVHDVIFYFTKSKYATRNDVYLPYSEDYINTSYRHIDETGRRYQLDNITGPGGAAKGNPQYEFLGITRYWRYSKETMKELYEKGLIIQTNPGTVPRFKRYLDETKGVPIQDVFDDILTLQASAAERLGYPTQKPVALLERIVRASSNEGDVVLDPFCGCGTTIAAAQKLNRRWIGIDVTHLSIALQKYRLKDAFGLEPIGKKSEPSASTGGSSSTDSISSGATGKLQPTVGADDDSRRKLQSSVGADASDRYQIVGEPEDLNSARQLALEDRYQFQWWALSLIKARPLGAASGGKIGKKGSDRGIDGVIVFTDDNSGRAKRVLVQVKSGKVKSGDIRDLVGTITREDAVIGVFITLENATREMQTEAVSAGFYHSDGWHRDFPKMQILTVEDLLNGKEVQMPPNLTTFKQAERIRQDDGQHKLF